MTEATYPAQRYAWYVIAIFFLAAILSYTDRLILNLLVDPIRHDLGVSDTQVSLLQGAAFAVLYAFVGLPLGLFADRHNRRNLIFVGVVIWSIGTALCGFAGNFHLLFGARVLVGLGEAALAPAVMSMIPDYFPPQRRGTAIGIFLTGMAMGGGAAVIAGGMLFDAFNSGYLVGLPIVGHMAPWRAALVVLALPGALIALLVLTIREPQRQERLTAPAQGDGLAATLGYFKANRWTFICLFTAFALGNLISYGSDSWLPSVYIRKFALSQGQVGTMIGVVSLIAYGVGTISGGLVSDYLQRDGQFETGLRFTAWASVAAVPFLIFPLMPTVVASLAVYLVYTIIASMAVSSGLTAVQNAVPSEMRGFAVSLQAFMYTLIGLGLGPTLVAFATDHVYGNPKLVGLSIFTVALPASIASLLLLFAGLPFYRATRGRVVKGKAQ